MCGLVGMAGKITVKEERVLKTLLTLDALRGTDSTGIAVVPAHSGMVKMAKEIGVPYNLFETKAYDKALMGSHRAIIGHNRFATQGVVNRHNAHPYDFDTLVGAHNGTLKNKWKLDDNKDFDVDSKNLYHHIDKHGLRDAINIIEGAWALTWWDKLEETINFLRNDERPLCLARSKDTKTLFWASEAWMLSVALSRENIEKEDTIQLPINMHHSIHIKNNGDMEKPVVTVMAAKPVGVYKGNWIGTYYPKAQATATSTPAVVAPVGQQQKLITTATTPHATTKPTLVISKDIDKKIDGEQKNSQVVPISTKRTTIGLKPGYENSKNVSLEVESLGVDRFGANYYRCVDVEEPSLEIRLYYNSNKNVLPSSVGTRFTADIQNARFANASEPGFYKVAQSSVRLIDEEKKKDEEVTDNVYRNARGHMVDFNTWMNQHGSCDNCGGNVFPTESYKFTRHNGAICEFCTEDETVQLMNGWRK